MSNTIQLQDLLRQPVRDQRGRVVGHIEEVIAEWEGEELFVQEFHTGSVGLLEHLTTITLGAWLPRFIKRNSKSYVINWNQIDLSDLQNIRITCNRSELRHA